MPELGGVSVVLGKECQDRGCDMGSRERWGGGGWGGEGQEMGLPNFRLC